MSSRRPPAAPPVLEGFDYVQHLGSGGFADVFLYQQHLPLRRVAVKVMHASDVSPTLVDDFHAEANVMAKLSGHPSIVTIYETGVSAGGHPYLVMEYCPKPNLQVRYRQAPLGVPEALRIGIHVSAAVETAHRAGILHRDIKPANILVTDYNRPALTDFGIAGSAASSGEAAGMSPPWSPPEAFTAGAMGPASDVWSLGATLYTLLAGHSPFEVPGGKNGTADIIARIQHEPLRPLGRPDVPPALERVLASSMAKDASRRPSTAAAFARSLQKVEAEMGLSATDLDLPDEGQIDAQETDDDDGRTRVRPVTSIAAQPAAEVPFSTRDATVLRDSTGRPHEVWQAAPAVAPRTFAGATSDGTVRRQPAPTPHTFGAPAEGTVSRPRAIEDPARDQASQPPAAIGRRSRVPFIAAGVGIVVVGGIVAAAATGLLSGAAEPTPSQTSNAPQSGVVVQRQVSPVTDVTGTVDGALAHFTWVNPEPEAGDSYQWGVQVAGAARELVTVDAASIDVPYEGAEVCIEVYVRRVDGRRAADAAVGCVQ